MRGLVTTAGTLQAPFNGRLGTESVRKCGPYPSGKLVNEQAKAPNSAAPAWKHLQDGQVVRRMQFRAAADGARRFPNDNVVGSIKILRARREVPSELSQQLMEDTSADVRFEAFLAASELGRQFFDSEIKSILVKPANHGLLGRMDPEGEACFDRFRTSQLRQLPEEALQSLVDGAFPFNEREYLTLRCALINTRPNSKRRLATGLRDALRRP
jgi:hypothetical protein